MELFPIESVSWRSCKQINQNLKFYFLLYFFSVEPFQQILEDWSPILEADFLRFNYTQVRSVTTRAICSLCTIFKRQWNARTCLSYVGPEEWELAGLLKVFSNCRFGTLSSVWKVKKKTKQNMSPSLVGIRPELPVARAIQNNRADVQKPEDILG